MHRVLVAIGLAAAAVACVHAEQAEVEAAREAYARCVAEHSAQHAECQVLRERTHAAERRYEERSRSAWGCDPAREECPTPR